MPNGVMQQIQNNRRLSKGIQREFKPAKRKLNSVSKTKTSRYDLLKNKEMDDKFKRLMSTEAAQKGKFRVGVALSVLIVLFVIYLIFG